MEVIEKYTVAKHDVEYCINEAYRPIAEKLRNKFAELKHVPVENILFVERQEGKLKSNNKKVLGKVSKISSRYNEIIFQLTGQQYDFMIEIFKADTVHMTREQIVALIYHEMRHIQLVVNSGIKIVGHDIEDWHEMTAKLGLDWNVSGKMVPDLLGENITDWNSIEDPQVTFIDVKLQVVK